MLKYDLGKYRPHFKEYMELRAQKNASTQIRLLDGAVTANAVTSQAGFSARAYKSGLWGFASTPELGLPALDDAAVIATIRRAADNAAFLASKESGAHAQKGALPSRGGSDTKERGTKKPRCSQKDLIDYVKAVDAYVQKKGAGLASRSVSLQCLDMEKTLVTSDGSSSYSLIPRSIVAVSLTKNSKDGPTDLYDVFGGFGQFEDVFSAPDELFPKIDVLFERLEQKALGLYAKPGTHDVVLGPDLAGILAHEAIGHTVEADLVLGGSVATNYMDKEAASPLVTLVDFAHTALGKQCPVPVWIDDEGTLARDALLIDKGVLRSYMHNKESAAHFGVEPTGNARAFGFYDEPLIRMRNTAILPGASKLDDMIAGIDKGYYFVRASNGQADSTSEFMFGVVMGYEIKGGKLGQALRDATISGVAFDMLKTVSAVSDDMVWSCAGMCGKKQMIPVGMGGPAVRCRINVGGRA